jgi:hypothetical protein
VYRIPTWPAIIDTHYPALSLSICLILASRAWINHFTTHAIFTVL